MQKVARGEKRFGGDEAEHLRQAGRVLFERLIEIRDPAPHSAALNMALDEALLASVRMPTLRLYRWERPAVSFGYFGRHAAIAAVWAGRELVRRMTGGGVVPHGDDLTYSLIVPGGHSFSQRSPREIYRAVHEAVATVLSASGIVPALASAPDENGTGVCFESPAESDILAHGRKIAGAAMRRTRAGLLLQGSLQQVPVRVFVESGLPAAFGEQVVAREIAEPEFSAAKALAGSKYSTREWTERV